LKIQEHWTSADAKEGITVFLEKREPNFPAKVSKDMPEFFPWREK
jgi:1,4-dihydroxy-2-naphthoyl-CoA synthase